MPTSRGYYLRFPCPDCGATQKVLPAQVGTEIRCAECPAVIIVPSLDDLTAANQAINHKSQKKAALGKKAAVGVGDPNKPPPPPREVNIVRGHVISFACPVCHTMMRASEEELGHMTMCPNCYSPVTVGGEKHKKPSPPPSEGPALVLEDSGDEEYGLAEEDLQLAASLPLADYSSEAGEEESGEDEYRLSAPEERPPVSPRPPVLNPSVEDDLAPLLEEDLSGPARRPRERVGVGAENALPNEAWEIQERKDRPSLEDRLAEASGRIDYRDQELPDHPFLSGLGAFLFYPGVGKRWAGLSIGTAMVYYFTANAVLAGARGGSELFFSLIFAVMAAAAGLLLVMVEAVAMLAIVQDTAAGSEEIEDWPDFIFIDWAGQAFYVFNAIAFALLPGFLLASALETLGPVRWAALPVSFALLFPVILLSQLDGDSPFSILTPRIFRSIFKAPLAWIVFYFVSSAVLTAAVAVGAGIVLLGTRVAFFAWHGFATALLLGVLATAALMLESRLIGRLAWFCEEEEPPAELTPEEQEAAERELYD